MPNGWKFYIGFFFLIYSFVPMLSVAALPFLGFSLAASGLFALVFLATGELSFWIAAALLGKELVGAIKKRAFALFGRHGEIKPVSRFRHRLGITMLVSSFIPYYVTLGYLVAFEHRDPVIHVLTWVMIGGEVVGFSAVFVLGGLFWERFKSLFSWEAVNAVREDGIK
jgi:hypothetical protein